MKMLWPHGRTDLGLSKGPQVACDPWPTHGLPLAYKRKCPNDRPCYGPNLLWPTFGLSGQLGLDRPALVPGCSRETKLPFSSHTVGSQPGMAQRSCMKPAMSAAYRERHSGGIDNGDESATLATRDVLKACRNKHEQQACQCYLSKMRMRLFLPCTVCHDAMSQQLWHISAYST